MVPFSLLDLVLMAAIICFVEGLAKTDPLTAASNKFSPTNPPCIGSCPAPPPLIMVIFLEVSE